MKHRAERGGSTMQPYGIGWKGGDNENDECLLAWAATAGQARQPMILPNLTRNTRISLINFVAQRLEMDFLFFKEETIAFQYSKLLHYQHLAAVRA